jgi:putative tricarboxylic transport membrane protein
MEQDQNTSGEDKVLASTRTMEVAFGVVLLIFGSLVVYDTNRLGASWGDMGPEPGYFPFYIGLFILLAGVSNIISAFLPGNKADGDKPFVTRQQFKQVLMVFLPTLGYVILMQYIGLYSAAALFIIAFMMLNGKYPLIKCLPFAIIVPVFMFFMFEVWFLISLPKGPVEAFFGF